MDRDDEAIADADTEGAAAAEHVQVVQVFVAHGYHPSTIQAQAGVPLRLIFRRADPDACADRVVFSEPRLVRHLAPGADTIVDLPAAGEGEVRFTCAMGRYRGRIVRRSGAGRGGPGKRPRRVPAWAWLPLLWLLLLTTSIAGDAPGAVTWLVTTAISGGAALLILWPTMRAPHDGSVDHAPEATR